MRTASRTSTDLLRRRAESYEAMAARAKIRRDRALRSGNVREAAGAKISMQESSASARRLRAMIRQASPASART